MRIIINTHLDIESIHSERFSSPFHQLLGSLVGGLLIERSNEGFLLIKRNLRHIPEVLVIIQFLRGGSILWGCIKHLVNEVFELVRNGLFGGNFPAVGLSDREFAD